VADWGVVCLTRCKPAGPKSVSAGNGQPLTCAAVLQPGQSAAISEVVKAPLSGIVSGSMTSELPLRLPFHATSIRRMEVARQSRRSRATVESDLRRTCNHSIQGRRHRVDWDGYVHPSSHL